MAVAVAAPAARSVAVKVAHCSIPPVPSVVPSSSSSVRGPAVERRGDVDPLRPGAAAAPGLPRLEEGRRLLLLLLLLVLLLLVPPLLLVLPVPAQ